MAVKDGTHSSGLDWPVDPVNHFHQWADVQIGRERGLSLPALRGALKHFLVV